MKLKAKGHRLIDGLPPAPAIVLCRPQLGENVGTAARAMLNFGLSDMRLVQPRFGWPNAKAVASSSGAHDILNHMQVHETVGETLGDIHHLYATTARPREMVKPVIDARKAAHMARQQMEAGRKVAYLFGAERSGLTNEEIALADAIVTVPLNPDFSSLNLAQAVLLCGYEWHLATGIEAPTVLLDEDPPATKHDLEGLMQHLLDELDHSGFFKSDQRRESLALVITLMLERRSMTQPEVFLLRGMIRSLTGRRQHQSIPADGGTS